MRRPPAVARVLERVTATSRTHHLFLPNQTALLAVSGGPDSVCLAETMVRLRRLLKVRLEIVHVDAADPVSFGHEIAPRQLSDAALISPTIASAAVFGSGAAVMGRPTTSGSDATA